MNEALPGSVAHEAIQFLRCTDLVNVSTTMLAKGIGRQVKRLHQQLAPAVHAGLLSRTVDGGFAFWKLGSKLDSDVPPAETPDEQSIQRVVKVSANATPSIFAYADQRAAAPFAVALFTDGRMALERHGRLLAELTNSERLVLVKSATEGVTA
jgi:hypothetical protein